jgi:hypothetical protein
VRILRKNEPAVASETIDGEVVAIHLDKGVYYSLQGSAAQIWTLLEERQPVEVIVAALADHCGSEASEIETSVNRFVEELRGEELVVEAGEVVDPVPAPRLLGRASRFETPVLSKYTDMQDLLLLDPIHEVDDTGWPNVRSKPRD